MSRPADPSRLLIRAPNWLGDAVMALPALEVVRVAFAGTTIAVAAPRSVAPLFHEITVASPNEILTLSDVERDDARVLAGGGFDAVLLLPNSFHAAWVARKAGIRERWGYGANARRWMLTRAVPRPKKKVHQSEYYLALVQGLGIGGSGLGGSGLGGSGLGGSGLGGSGLGGSGLGGSGLGGSGLEGSGLEGSGLGIQDQGFAIRDAGLGIRDQGSGIRDFVRVRPETFRRAGEVLARHGVESDAPLVGFAPGAAYGHAKRWPPRRVAELVTRVWRERGAVGVLVGAAGDRDAGREIESAVPSGVPVVNLIGRTDLRLLAGVLAHCRAFVSNDSGAMHLAAAIGVPVAAIFGPTDDRVTAPLGDHAVLIHQVFCRPCMLRDCPIDHRCMKGITVDAVFSAVARHL